MNRQRSGAEDLLLKSAQMLEIEALVAARETELAEAAEAFDHARKVYAAIVKECEVA